MAFISDLSAELLLQIFSRLVLKSIINARGVCRFWRHTVLEADFHPVRRQLLRLYDELLDMEIFIRSRSRFLDTTLPFNRQGYLDSLRSQMAATSIPPVLPIAFEIFILEWPAAAAFDSIWPGIVYEWTEKDVGFRRQGWNYLNYISPQLFELEIVDSENNYIAYTVAALPILQAHGGVSYWIIMDSRHFLFGRTIFIDGDFPSYETPKPYSTSVHYEITVEKWERICESVRLPFCDWLDVSVDRWNTGVSEIYYGKAVYDEELKRWKDGTNNTDLGEPFPDPDGSDDDSYVLYGGNMKRFNPITPPVRPLVSFSYAFDCLVADLWFFDSLSEDYEKALAWITFSKTYPVASLERSSS